MVAFVWSVTTVLTIFAFATAIVLTVKVHTHYKYLEKVYNGDDWYQASDAYYNNDNSGDENGSQDERYREQIRESFMLLSSMSAKSVTFVAVYTMILATSLSMYGSMAIVGLTSLRGVYIAPCLPIGTNKLRVGIFGGMIVIFANLLLVCAVVLGEVKVRDGMHTHTLFVCYDFFFLSDAGSFVLLAGLLTWSLPCTIRLGEYGTRRRTRRKREWRGRAI